MKAALAVALGGAIGSLARYGLGLLYRGLPIAFPLATLTVNVVGGFLMGMIAGAAIARPDFSPVLKLGLTTGVLGGFTTFSAFSLETLMLWREGGSAGALANILLNVALSLAACAAGFALSSR